MTSIRPIEKQFDKKKAQQIKALINRATKLRDNLPRNALRYYFHELSTTLEAGALLASLSLVTVMLELFVRVTLIELEKSNVRFDQENSFESPTFQENLEESRELNFVRMIDYLVNIKAFKKQDSDLAKEFYCKVRTPLAHGLLERFIYGRPEEKDALSRMFSLGKFTQSSTLENFIENNALKHIEDVVQIIEVNIRNH